MDVPFILTLLQLSPCTLFCKYRAEWVVPNKNLLQESTQDLLGFGIIPCCMDNIGQKFSLGKLASSAIFSFHL